MTGLLSKCSRSSETVWNFPKPKLNSFPSHRTGKCFTEFLALEATGREGGRGGEVMWFMERFSYIHQHLICDGVCLWGVISAKTNSHIILKERKHIFFVLYYYSKKKIIYFMFSFTRHATERGSGGGGDVNGGGERWKVGKM